jgi:branched-subunit amino acid aminotransferase/4-amino-4-deoxychorismate lyase
MSLAWVDGRLLDAARALPVEDAAFRAGRALFETVGAQGGRLPLWTHHLARLTQGAAMLRIGCEPPRELRPAAEELLRLTGQQDGVLRIVLTAGGPAERPRWVLATRERSPEAVVRLAVAEAPLPDDWPFATIKCAARPHYAIALAAAQQAGAGDALLLARDGTVAETATANLFARIGGRLVTPRATGRFLPGIARRRLLERMAVAGEPVDEVDLSLDRLRAADAILVTNAVYGPRPAELPGGPPAAADPALARVWQQVLAAG